MTHLRHECNSGVGRAPRNRRRTGRSNIARMTIESTPSAMRIEKDALGEVPVPADHLWGAQTQRSVVNFPIGVDRFTWGREVIRAFGVLKKCAAHGWPRKPAARPQRAK